MPSADHRALAFMDGLPRAEPLGQLAPLTAGAQPTNDSVDHLSVIPPPAAPVVTPGQQRFQHRPLAAREIPPAEHVENKSLIEETPPRPNWCTAHQPSSIPGPPAGCFAVLCAVPYGRRMYRPADGRRRLRTRRPIRRGPPRRCQRPAPLGRLTEPAPSCTCRSVGWRDPREAYVSVLQRSSDVSCRAKTDCCVPSALENRWRKSARSDSPTAPDGPSWNGD